MMARLVAALVLLPLGVVALVYDEAATLRELKLAQASYCVAPGSTAWTCPTCVEGVEVHSVFDAGGGRAVVGYDAADGHVFVAFRGSENIPNWIHNLEFVKAHPWPTHPDVGVEDGFFNWYAALRNGGLVAALGEVVAKYPGRPLKLNAHSAGSAPAVFLAYEIFYGLFESNATVSRVTTFGSPRLGDDTFVRAYNATTATNTRVTHYRDCVPHLPTDDMFWLRYAHVPTEVYYDEANMKHVTCDGSGEDQTCSDECTLCTSIEDHLSYLNLSLGLYAC